jgi:amidophosphoribosyltransferase
MAELERGYIAELEDKPGEECGVFGIYLPGEPGIKATALTYNALHTLQHRGQDAAGIHVQTPEGYIRGYKDVGLLKDAMQDGDHLRGLPAANIASGHVRYGTSTAKSLSERRNAAQPMLGGQNGSKFALSHNGHLINFDELRAASPQPDRSYTDSQLITNAIEAELSDNAGLYGAIVAATEKLSGAYSMVIMGENKLYGVRDPKGFRPLMLGRLPDNGWALASEVAALDIIDAGFEREVEPGEIVEISEAGLKSYKPYDPREVSTNVCAFEFVYTSRPDNVIEGEPVAITRYRAGRKLAKLFPADADLVADSPDSGTIAAKGYARESGLPLLDALVRNRYIGRTFMADETEKRKEMLRSKLNPVRSIVEGKSVVIVDDSIIRGNTFAQVVQGLWNVGAKEVHIRIASAPYAWPCFMGMDTGDRGSLIAAHMSIDEMCEALNATSLDFLDVEQFESTLGRAAGKVCLACMNGEYPLPVPSEKLGVNGSHPLAKNSMAPV